VDTEDRFRAFLQSMVPWDDLPGQFRDPRRFPPNIGLGQFVRAQFMGPFVLTVLDPKSPRNLMLRGQFSQATPKLEREQRLLDEQKKRREVAVDLEKQVDEWVEKALPLYARQITAREAKDAAALAEAERQIDALWKQADAVGILLGGATVTARNAEVTYLLALCTHERAEQLQAQLDRAAAPTAEDVRGARDEWKEALSSWDQFLGSYPDRPGQTPDRPNQAAARRLRARALEALGDRFAALEAWQDLSGTLSDLEKVAALTRARQVRRDLWFGR
jgi:hypothetical protein